MKVKFKKLHKDAVLPSYAKTGDAGMDLVATENGRLINSGEAKDQWYYIEYGTGLAMELDSGFVGLLFPRSSISKSSLILANSVGVVDASFRGEICLRFKIDAGLMNQSIGEWSPAKYKKGERVGQLIILPYPTIEPEFVDELSDTDRGTGGFGSTGQ